MGNNHEQTEWNWSLNKEQSVFPVRYQNNITRIILRNDLNFSTTQHKWQSAKKITDHPRLEPGTLALLAPRSTNWADVSDGEER